MTQATIYHPFQRKKGFLGRFLSWVSAFLFVSAVAFPPVQAQRGVTTPRQQFGHDFGDDYWLPNYSQLMQYWQKLARESERMQMVRIGTTGEGRPMWMAILSSPENLKRLEHYRSISGRLANAEGLTDAEAKQLAAEGKVVVWIDGGLHSNETLGIVQLGQIVYELASQTDPETMRFLRDAIILAVPANPDGMELVSNWYMRRADSTKRTTSGLPRLYNKYAGHDNNRDAYMVTQPETRAMDSILFRAWYPQIMYNHHQTAPAGTVMASAPYRDPFNYNFDPLIPAELDLVGAAMTTRFIQEGKPGVTVREGSDFSTWWNGGLRTTVYFHNIIGILTETIGSPTPSRIPLVPNQLLPRGTLMDPVLPQTWHFKQSVAYETSANRAILDVATRQREQFLYNIYRMGRNSIERGSRDNWTITPRRVAAVQHAADRVAEQHVDGNGDGSSDGNTEPRGTSLSADSALRILHDPRHRDARVYIIPGNFTDDVLTETKFVNALIATGVKVLRAREPFVVDGDTFPAHAYIIKTAQAFRPHILDMFEPQDYPNDIPYPGGPPTAPYDNAGWTLALQMGVKFRRVLHDVDGPFDPIVGNAVAIGKTLQTPASLAREGDGWYTWSALSNDAFVLVNRLLAAGVEVHRDTAQAGTFPGTFRTRVTPAAYEILAPLVQSTHVHVSWAPLQNDVAGRLLHPVRIALWDVYGGSRQSGWTRYLLDQFGFTYDVVYPPQLDAGHLRDKYDVLILPDGAVIGPVSGTRPGSPPPSDVPEEYKSHVGEMTREKTLPAVKQFLKDGGVVLASGSATWLAYQLDLPIASALVDSVGNQLERTQYYIPGSILSVAYNHQSELTRDVFSNNVMFDESPAFTLLPGAKAAGVTRVAWFNSPTPLVSGWAWGQQYLQNAAAIVSAPVGKGTLVLYGPEMNFRGQSHGTFKLLFNGIYLAASAPSSRR